MIYNQLNLANALLALFEFFHDSEKNGYLLEAFKGCGESGYTLLCGRTDKSASFAQSAGGDDLVIYPCVRWDLYKLLHGDDRDAMDNIAVFFNCDDLKSAVDYLLDYFGE